MPTTPPWPSHHQDQSVSELRQDQDFKGQRPSQNQDQGMARPSQDQTSASPKLHDTIKCGEC